LGRIGETIEATLCDPGITGFPDRRTDLPVRVQLVSEQVLSVDDDSRAIIWGVVPLRNRASPMPLGHMIQLAHIFFWLDEGGGTPQNRLNKIRSGGGRGSR
jgi:hypothetical protein